VYRYTAGKQCQGQDGGWGFWEGIPFGVKALDEDAGGGGIIDAVQEPSCLRMFKV